MNPEQSPRREPMQKGLAEQIESMAALRARQAEARKPKPESEEEKLSRLKRESEIAAKKAASKYGAKGPYWRDRE